MDGNKLVNFKGIWNTMIWGLSYNTDYLGEQYLKSS